jgi:hypothetical protein
VQKERSKVQVNNQNRPCEHAQKYQRAADKFETNVKEFLRVVKEVIDHLLLEGCQECQNNLIRDHQFPEGCCDPSLGHRVVLYEDPLAEFHNIPMDKALDFILTEEPYLRREIDHVRKCLSCNLVISEARGEYEA